MYPAVYSSSWDQRENAGGRELERGGGSGEGSNEVKDGATNTKAESEETTNQNSPSELAQ